MTITAGEAAHVGMAAGAVQKPAELARLLEILEARWAPDGSDPLEGPPIILEIGSYKGGTLAAWRAMWPDAFVISVDRPDPAGPHELEDHGALTITGDSHEPGTLELVRVALEGTRGPDLVFVDGDHSEEGCTRDVEDYGLLLEGGALLALHDVRPYFPGRSDPLGPELVWARLERWASSLAHHGGHFEAVPCWRRIGEIIDRVTDESRQPDEWGGIGLAERLA